MAEEAPGCSGSEETPKPRGFYLSANEAHKKVCGSFEHWSGRFTETSTQMCYALIGANLVVFGSVNGILQNVWAKLSLSGVIIALACSVLGAWLLSEALRKIAERAEEKPAEWEQEFKRESNKKSPWPFTKPIEPVEN